MKQVRIQCLNCGKLVIVSTLQPCFYCGRLYKDEEIDQLLQTNKAEPVEVEKLLAAQGPSVAPVLEVSPMPWKKLILVMAALFFLFFCMICLWLIIRFI